MAYIKFNNDPVSKRVSSAFANICSGDPVKQSVSMLENEFSVFNGSTKTASFTALRNFIFPADSSSLIDFEVCSGETLMVFDNLLEEIDVSVISGGTVTQDRPIVGSQEFIESVPPGTDNYYLLANDRNYVRGILLYVRYPSLDKNGNDILPADNECQLTITNRQLDSMTLPLYQFYAHFANPETRAADGLINKLELVNPATNPFSIKVSGLIIYTKSNNDPNDCSC